METRNFNGYTQEEAEKVYLQQRAYSEAVRLASESERNQDPDRDGLSTREERMMGLNPYEGDTDGDHELDGAELTTGGDPGDRFNDPQELAQERERLRAAYLEVVAWMMKWTEPYKDWNYLYDQLAGDKTSGTGMDFWVMEQSVYRLGKTPSEAAEVLLQSPFLHYHKNQGEITAEDIVGYVNYVKEGFERGNPDWKRTQQLLKKEKANEDFELERERY